MSKLIEEWRDINGYEGLYYVSDWGNIKNKKGKIIAKEFFKGYYRVHLWKNGKGKHLFIHRLVAIAFIPNQNNYPQINHIDENKLNNRVENLEWCTAEYNSNYGTRKERNSKNQINDPKKSKPILVYTYPSMELIGCFPSESEVKRQFGVNNVAKVVKGLYTHDKGYTFRYA